MLNQKPTSSRRHEQLTHVVKRILKSEVALRDGAVPADDVDMTYGVETPILSPHTARLFPEGMNADSDINLLGTTRVTITP